MPLHCLVDGLDDAVKREGLHPLAASRHPLPALDGPQEVEAVDGEAQVAQPRHIVVVIGNILPLTLDTRRIEGQQTRDIEEFRRVHDLIVAATEPLLLL